MVKVTNNEIIFAASNSYQNLIYLNRTEYFYADYTNWNLITTPILLFGNEYPNKLFWI